MRIFLGLHEVCNITYTYAKAFKALGYETFTAVARQNPYYLDSSYDIVLGERGQIGQRLMRWFPLVYKAITTCDVFVFTFVGFTPWLIELPLLRAMGKKIVVVFWGSDAREINIFEEQMRGLGILDEYLPFIKGVREQRGEPLHTKLNRIRRAERYADLILSQPGYAQLQNRPYMRANVPLDLSLFNYHVPCRSKPLIIHAPSNPLIKGTNFIKRIINELAEEGMSFDFHLAENVPNSELRALLSSADIVVDELYADTVGVFSTEGMATGNAVLTHYPAKFAGVPGSCPAINVNEKNLKEQLRHVILNVEERHRFAQRGREYVETYNDSLRIVSDLMIWLENKDNLQYNFYPSDMYKPSKRIN
jgi:hypothetical protein